MQLKNNHALQNNLSYYVNERVQMGVNPGRCTKEHLIYVFKGLIIKDCHASIWKCDNIQKHSVKYKREAFGEMNYTSTNGARCSSGERAVT